MPTRTNRQCANDFIKVFDNFMRTDVFTAAYTTGWTLTTSWTDVKAAYAALVASRKSKNRCTVVAMVDTLRHGYRNFTLVDPRYLLELPLYFPNKQYAQEYADALNKARGL